MTRLAIWSALRLKSSIKKILSWWFLNLSWCLWQQNQNINFMSAFNDAKIKKATCKVCGVSEVSIVWSEHEVPLEGYWLMVMLPIQFHWSNQLWNLNSPLVFQRITALWEFWVVLVQLFCWSQLQCCWMQRLWCKVTANCNNQQHSNFYFSWWRIRQKESLWISNVVVVMFANIVLWMVVWCFDRFIQWQWITLKMPSCSSHLCQLHQSEFESYSTSFSEVILRLGFQSSRDQ